MLEAILNEALGLAAAIHNLNQDGAIDVADLEILSNAALGLGCLGSGPESK
jgi:hypothetical protein